MSSPPPQVEMEAKTLAKDSFEIHYYTKGNPQHDLLVFVHPAFGDHNCFSAQIDFFAEHYHVLALDMPGHGRSQVPPGTTTIADTPDHIAAIMAQENHDTCHVVGVSLGSLVAQDFAARYPERVKTVSVLGGYSIYGDNRDISRAQLGESLKWMVMLIFSMNRFRNYVVTDTVIHPDAQAQFRQCVASFTRRSFLAMNGTGRLMHPDEPPPDDHPLLILMGDHDRELVKKAATRWHEAVPSSEFHTLTNAGHCANMDDPAQFNDLLLQFLRSHSGG